MDIRQLQLLVEIVEAGSLSKVCAAHGIAQSVLSKQVSVLEEQFGAKLFYRTGRGVVLNEFGQDVLPRVRSLLAEAELLKDEIEARAGIASGPVRLAMQASITQSLVGELFRRVQRQHARIQLRVMEGFAGSIEEALASGRADVGVLSRYNDRLSRLDEALATDVLYLVSPKGDQLGSEPIFRFRDLVAVPLVLPGMPDAFRMMLAEVARNVGVALSVPIEVDSLVAMKEIVAEGGGYTILSRQAVVSELQMNRVQISEIIEPTLTRTLVLSTSLQRPLSSATRAVAAIVRTLLGSEQWSGVAASTLPHGAIPD